MANVDFSNRLRTFNVLTLWGNCRLADSLRRFAVVSLSIFIGTLLSRELWQMLVRRILLIAKVAEATSHLLFPPHIERIAPNILSILSVENLLVRTNLNLRSCNKYRTQAAVDLHVKINASYVSLLKNPWEFLVFTV